MTSQNVDQSNASAYAETPQHDDADRRMWMGALAKASEARLEALWDALEEQPNYRNLRNPESGLVMVRGRVGGVGNRFNLGEMTVTRCTVRLDSGETGTSYRAGRGKRASEIAAAIDAMMQSPEWKLAVSDPIVGVLVAEQRAVREQTARRSAATKVDFFTMTRKRKEPT